MIPLKYIVLYKTNPLIQMPKEGELWRNKHDGRIVKIVNISTGLKRRTFLRIMAYNPFRRRTVGSEDVLVLDSSWDQNWEKYEHDDSSGVDPRATSSVSTPKKNKSKFSSDAAVGDDVPMTVKKSPPQPPLPLRKLPPYKDGGVNPNHPYQQPEGPNAAREAAILDRQQRIQWEYEDDEEEELNRMLTESDPNSVTNPPLSPQEERIRSINNNLGMPNSHWTLRRQFDGNIMRLEIGQDVLIELAGPTDVGIRFNISHNRNGSVHVSRQLFYNGTFEFRAWSLTSNTQPRPRPSIVEAERAAIRAREFGFFKDNINIKF
jgi:hypothetical protein